MAGEHILGRKLAACCLNILTTKLFAYHTWIMVMGGLGLLALLLPDGPNAPPWLNDASAHVDHVDHVVTQLLHALVLPHWSQKYLFDTYYDACTREQNPSEVDEAYEPLIAKVGLPGVAEFFGWEGKVVCKEDVISWRITWRGETYYSYNELKPITKEANQFLPYLEEMNHGNTFYVLMERGKSKTDGFKNKLRTYSDKLRRKGVAGLGRYRRMAGRHPRCVLSLLPDGQSHADSS